MRYYLASFTGKGTDAAPFRPRGVDTAGRWSIVDLRPDPTKVAGWCVVGSPTAIPTNINVISLGADPDAPSPTMAALFSSKLGIAVNPAVPSLRRILRDLLVAVDDKPWNPLRPSRRDYGVWLGGERLVLMPVVAGGATYTDDFNRANGAVGADWTVVDGTWVIASNRLQRSGAGFGTNESSIRYAHNLDSDDHYSQIDFTGQGSSTNGYMGPAVRFAAAAETYYGAYSRAGSSLRVLRKVVAGTVTDLASSGGGGGPTRQLRLEVNGSDLEFYDNGTLALSVTDTSIIGNLRAGVMAHATAGGSITGDNFRAGDLADVFRLIFDLAPDDIATGGAGHVATISVRMVVDGAETILGNQTSLPEAGNDGIREWKTVTVDVTDVFDAAADELYVRWQHVAGDDTGYVRDLRVEDGTGLNVWWDQYVGDVPDDHGGSNDAAASDGGTSPSQADTCSAGWPMVVNSFSDFYVRHLIIPTFACPPPGSGLRWGTLDVGVGGGLMWTVID